MNIRRKMWEIRQLLRLYMRLKLSLDLLKVRIVSMAVSEYEDCFRACFSVPMTTCMPPGVHSRWSEKKPFHTRFDAGRRADFLKGCHRGRTTLNRGGRYARHEK
jgi:hypothetical protein